MNAIAASKEAIRSTFTKGVLGDVGGFGGLFRPDFSGYEEPILVAHAAVGLEKRLCFLRLLFMQRQKNLCTAALEGPFSVDSVREKIFQGGE